MDTAILMHELAALDTDSRRRMIAYLLSLDTEGNLAYRQKLSDKIDNRDPARWTSGEELNRKLGLEDSE